MAALDALMAAEYIHWEDRSDTAHILILEGWERDAEKTKIDPKLAPAYNNNNNTDNTEEVCNMASKLTANGVYEGSRLILPEHMEAYLAQLRLIIHGERSCGRVLFDLKSKVCAFKCTTQFIAVWVIIEIIKVIYLKCGINSIDS
ncbi:hypothetical protein [Paenibacillus xylanexedens]|uniref:hypothetical protein n=1 Tax=Paenibacillus xylanexedens TaxID=528191 RepID=UPI0011A88937|nr:hypothetical protein [Paenibacillus xylanexedens]